MSFNKILVAVDDTRFAARTADLPIELAKNLKSTLGFVHVFDPSVRPGTPRGVPRDRSDEINEHAARCLIARLGEKTDGKGCRLRVRFSRKACLKIIESARYWAADLLVMGSHARGKIQGCS